MVHIPEACKNLLPGLKKNVYHPISPKQVNLNTELTSASVWQQAFPVYPILLTPSFHLNGFLKFWWKFYLEDPALP